MLSNNISRFCLIAILYVLTALPATGQHVSVSTNAVQWANFGTVNMNAGISMARHLSVEAGFRYNPFTFHKSSGLMLRNQQTTAFAGVRWWPWYVFSGWWISGRGQYSKFSDTGIWRYALNEGSKVGAVLSCGYTLMVSRKINIEFGIGGWGGIYVSHNLYHCPSCMERRECSSGAFGTLDDLSVSIMYMF